MQANDFQKFKEGLQGVMSFYRQEVSDFALDVWWSALKIYDLRAISEAFGKHVANPDNGQFPPKPADIVRMLQGSSQDSALVAWSKVDKAVRSIGLYETVVFDDPIIHRVIMDMGGSLQSLFAHPIPPCSLPIVLGGIFAGFGYPIITETICAAPDIFYTPCRTFLKCPFPP